MKHPALYVLLVCAALITAYIVFLGAVSISVGLQHPNQQGSWMPVVTGVLCILVVLWFLFRVVRSVLQALTKEDTLNLR